MKNTFLRIFYYGLTITICVASYTRSKDYRKISSSAGSELVPSESRTNNYAGEPTCEELRAMWRFSKRQSRAAEITNEIPTFRDPFAYNIWDQYARPRSVIGGVRTGGRSYTKPVYGRIVQNAPHHHPRLNLPEKTRAYEEVLKYFGDASRTEGEPKRKHSSVLRLSGGSINPTNRLAQKGSFQHLKELIWAERAKELQHQRMMEKAAARSAALKDVEVPSHYSRAYQDQPAQSIYYLDPEEEESRNIGRISAYDIDQYNNGMRYSQGQDRYRKPYRPQNVYDMLNTDDRMW